MRKKPITPASARRVALILFLIAIVAGSLAGMMAVRTLRFLQTAQTAPGTVTALERSRSGKSRGYTPVFQFTDKTGTTHTVRAKVSSSPPAYSVGESIEVLYDPNDIQGAEPRGWLNWFFTFIFALPAAILTFIGTVFLLISFRQPRLQ